MVKLILVNIFIIFAVQRCTAASVPESSSVPEQGGEGRGADGRSGQVRHRRTRREAAVARAGVAVCGRPPLQKSAFYYA